MIEEGAVQEAEDAVEEEDVPDPDAFEVSIVDDTPEEDRGRAKQADDADDAEGEDEDLDETQFSKRIQKRINKLRYDYNEERREKERFQRENTEAVNYAQSIQSQNEDLRNQSAELRRLLYDQVAAKTDTEIESVKRRYKEAYENGDTDSVVSAQEDLSRLYAEKTRFSVESDSFEQQAVPQQQAVQQQQPNIPPPDPMAVDWLKRNAWFQQPGYEEMTGYAVGLHEKLVKQGVDPRNNPSYYENIDTALQKQFSEFFGEGQEQASEAPTSRRTPVVAPSKRGTGRTPRKVELTSTQVSLAKKLGLSPQQYAAQLVKEMSNG
jgi:hypothetical protein|tara:strand:+ start:102 stop:1067 length:966 start_codon:yes stop_codon:yes gene_type:complete